MVKTADLVKRLHGSDELLGPCVTEEISGKALNWLAFFATKLGVLPQSVKESFIVNKLIEAYAFREVCVMKSYGLNAPFGIRSGNDNPDYYGRKLEYYEKRIKMLEKSITAQDLVRGDEDIVEDKPFKNYRAVSLRRG